MIRSAVGSRPLVQSLATGGLGQLLLVVSGVIVARSLGPHNRGVIALLTFLPLIASQLASAGIPLATTYSIARDGVRPRALLRRLAPVLVLQFVVAEIAQGALVRFLLLPKSPPGLVLIAVISLVISAALLAQTYGLAVLQGERRFAAFNIQRTAPACLYAAGVVALAATHSATLESIAVVWIISSSVSAAATLAVTFRDVGAPERVSVVVPPISMLVSFGARSVLGGTSPISAYRLDQLVVGAALTPAMLGLYVAAAAFTNLTRFLGQSIGMVAYPTIAADVDPNVRIRRMRRYFIAGTATCSLVTVVLVVAIPWLLPALFGRKFDGAVTPARLLLIAGLFAALRRILADATRGAGRPSWGTLAELATLTALPLALIAIELGAGLKGVSIALVVGDGIGLLVLLPSLARADLALRFVRRADQSSDIFAAALPCGLVAIAAGYAAVHVDSQLISEAVAAAILVPVFSVLISRCARLRGLVSPRYHLGGAENPAAAHLTTSRLFFFGGLLTLGLLTVRPVAGFTLSDILFLSSALFAVLYLFQSEIAIADLLPLGVWAGMVLFALGGLLTAVFISDPLPTLAVVARVVYLLTVWLVLPPILLRTPRLIVVAAACWAGSAAVGASGALIQLAYGDVIRGGSMVGGRFSGFTDGFNQLGGLVATAAPVALGLLLYTFKETSRGRTIGIAAFGAAFGLLIAGLMLSGSVTGLLASVLGVCVLVMLVKIKLSLRFAVIATGVVSAAILSSILATGNQTNPLQRLTASSPNPQAAASFTLAQRMTGYRLAWGRIERDPLIGVGLAGPTARTNQGGVARNVVHNILLGSWHQAGLLGLIGILLILGSMVNVTRGVLRRTDFVWRFMVAGLAGSVAATLVESMGQPILFQRYCWIGFGLLLAFRSLKPAKTLATHVVGLVDPPSSDHVSLAASTA